MEEKKTVFDGANRRELKEALEAYGLAPNKSLGQNFLCDPNACDAIVALGGDLSGKRVLEIGPGAGALTVRLHEAAKSVAAVELDEGLYRLLSERLCDLDRLTLIHGDGLKVDLGAIMGEEPGAVVANLPYYITTPLIMRCLTELPQVDTLVLMMQKEVAARLTATQGKDYSSISIAVNYYASMERGLTLPPECFFPAPKVDSTVVVMHRRPYRLLPENEALFFRVTRAAFAMRRKTILNNLGAQFEKDAVQKALDQVGIPPATRGERIGIDDFIRLSDALNQLI